MKSAIYDNQDRGSQKEYQQYLEAMDAISIEKVASASVFFEPKEGNTIIDVGMASGTSTAILAELFPQLNIIGVDINSKMVEIANGYYQKQNLEFRVDDGEKLTTFDTGSVNGFFNCSSIHHITSFNGYDKNRAYNTLKRQAELLADKGVIVIRDFVKPEEREVYLELSAVDKADAPSDSDLLIRFSKEARSLSNPEERGFPVTEVKCNQNGKRRFRLFLSDAVEFVRRKDYFSNWDIELQEEYGYFTQKEFEEIFQNLGLRIILSSPIYNRWIINNRYKDQFQLFDLNDNILGFPPTNYLIAGEKISGGKHISLVRHLPLADHSFLEYSSYRHKDTGEVYDLASRPNEVIDILPYFKEGERVIVLAKHGYPRPLAALTTSSPNIDNKRYSGYITEAISASKTSDISSILSQRFGIKPNQYSNLTPSLSYYTSPGGIDEKVSAVHVPLTSMPQSSIVLKDGFSGFKESGHLHYYDAQQLLSTAQTGALPEARLEMNIYHLLNSLHVKLPKWLGEPILLNEGFSILPSAIQQLDKDFSAPFVPVDEQNGFLKSHKACFTELGQPGSLNSIEFVTPARCSTNTLLTIPVNKIGDKIFVGLEVRELPVPQKIAGNSKIYVAPAQRLQEQIGNLFEMEEHIKAISFGNSKVKCSFKLGEKYFPSIGITPEQVYPYAVCLDSDTDKIAWFNLNDLLLYLDKIEDAHTLIALFRLKHALGV